MALTHDKNFASDQEKDVHEVSSLAKRIRRGEYNAGALRKQQLKPDFVEPIPDGSRRRMKKRAPLTIGEKISIVHQVLVGHEKQADVAKAHRVSPGVVAALMLKTRRSPKFLKEMLERAASVDSLRQNIMKSV